LWKTLGLTIRPWREDVIFGAERQKNSLKIYISAQKAWQGKIIFDIPRHQVQMKMPLDWPRINQFPEWFTVRDQIHYLIEYQGNNEKELYMSGELHQGLDIKLKPGEEKYLIVWIQQTK
jgi:hypothetical protein